MRLTARENWAASRQLKMFISGLCVGNRFDNALAHLRVDMLWRVSWRTVPVLDCFGIEYHSPFFNYIRPPPVPERYPATRVSCISNKMTRMRKTPWKR
jgi:hypothetical protein